MLTFCKAAKELVAKNKKQKIKELVAKKKKQKEI